MKKRINKYPDKFVKPVAVQLYQQGISALEISRRCNINPTTVYMWIKSVDVSTQQKRWSQDAIRDAVNLYVNDYKIVEIAKEIGAERSTVTKWVKKARVTKSLRRYPDLDKKRAIKLYNKGNTIAKVSRSLGIHESAAWRWLDTAGVRRGFIVNPDQTEAKRIRLSGEYKKWRTVILKRDFHTYQCCGTDKGIIDVHHKLSFAKCPSLRLELSNGITLCRGCHKKTANYGNN